MRKLLLLLPALALASCSGGHDLMSDKTFSMTCDAGEKFASSPSPHIVASVSPQLRQASVRVQHKEDDWTEEVWILQTITPTLLELVSSTEGGYANAVTPLQIDRQTGIARFFYTGDDPALENLTNCTFKSL